MALYRKGLAVRLFAFADKFRPGRRTSESLGNEAREIVPASAQAVEDLETFPAMPVSSSTSSCPHGQTGLLELPLVLVQDILEHLVMQNTPSGRKDRISLTDLLELRRVNKLFDTEIMKQLGRQFEFRSGELEECMWHAPTAFTVKLLREFIGENIRRDSGLFARRMHASMDTLLELSEAIGKPKERLEVLSHLCLALAKRRHMRTHFIPREDKEELRIVVAFMIAIAAGYTDLIAAMLQRRKINVKNQTLEFGYPIDVAIVLGSVESARVLIQNGTHLDNRSWSHTCQALGQAAGDGHLELIELIFDFMPLDMDHETFYTYGKVMCKAAESQQWEIVRCLLDTYLDDIQLDQGKNLLILAAKYGQDEIIEKVLENDIWDWNSSYIEYKSFPLREAAAGGHLSTCLLLIDKDLTGHVGPDRGEVMARFIAKGGSLDVYHRLKELKPGLWKYWHEIHFLPIAAYAGHLDFAKFAVEMRCDSRPKHTLRTPPAAVDWQEEIRYPEDGRYFALLCAVVVGHLDVVRWLVQEVGVDVNNKTGRGGDPDLVPMILAVLSGQVEMARMLKRELGAKPVPEAVSTKLRDVEYHEEVARKLNKYRRALHLRDDYKVWRPSGRKATVAWKAATAER